jgi:beta-glucosidase
VDTWARRYADYPSPDFSHNNGNLDEEYYTEGIYTGYRYFDTFGTEPQYPFGFGRSYTTFAIACGTAFLTGEEVCVAVTATNTGAVPGRETVQLYASAPEGELPKPFQELICFAKTGELAPGESETLTLRFKARQMASYSQARAAWILEAGDYLLRVGTSSRDTRVAAVVRLSGTVETVRVKNLFADTDPPTELTPPPARKREGFDAPVLFLLPGEVSRETAEYAPEERPVLTTDKTGTITMADVLSDRASVEELTAQLTAEELAEYCVGTARQDESVVGLASYTVPGAAGDTSSVARESRGIPNLIMADGPAGLRLQPVFKTDKEGDLLPGGAILGEYVEPFDPKYTDENSDTWYQYCTAIPIGWSLAMSWNMPLLESAGSMVGREMEQFGVDLWLAPAMNIHRNPLCGRNFEYYSEDPVISGKCAAAITLGVQSHPGKGVTVKHFAVNNQEDNRYFTNAHVSERALREIYLKGFEIAVKEARPLSVMTSYNLLNGIHTANSRDLIQRQLRDEWGFEGFVMTDWCTSQENFALSVEHPPAYPISASTGCIFAGNDVQMPGCQKNVDDILKALASGEELDGYRITLGDLQFCAANLLRVAAVIAGTKE